MSAEFNLCRDIGRFAKKLPWYESATPCPIVVIGVFPGAAEDSYDFNQLTVLSETGIPIADTARTYSGVDADEEMMVNSEDAIKSTKITESHRCYIGYDTEYQEFVNDDDERTARMLSHQLYFAHNGMRKGLIILTDLRFTESNFVELLAQAVPDEILTAYVAAHFSLVEGGWLKESRIQTFRIKHLNNFHKDPGTYAAAMAEGRYVMGLIASIFAAHKAAKDAKNSAHGAAPKSAVTLPSWISDKTVKEVIKAGSMKEAYKAFCLGNINGIKISKDGQNYLWETRQRCPVVPKRDKTWHGSTSLLTGTTVDSHQISAHQWVTGHHKRMGMTPEELNAAIAISIELRNTGYPELADKTWRKVAGRGKDGRRAKLTQTQRSAIPTLPKRLLVFVDTIHFGVGALKTLGETISIPKLDLNPGEIDQMEELLSNAQRRFCEYGFRDALVSAEGVAWFGRLFRIELGLPLSTRVASYTANHFERLFEQEVYSAKIAQGKTEPDRNLKKYLGWERRKNVGGSESWYPTPEMESFARFYAGGWNAVHQTGSLGPSTYWDLKSAYPTAVMMLQRDYDFSRQRVFRNQAASQEARKRIEGGPFQIMGLTISFRFKTDAEPMFPVRIDQTELPPLSPAESTDLFVYVRSGTTHITWPEFYTAVTMGLLEYWECSELVTYDAFGSTSKFAEEVYRLLELRGQQGKKVIYKNLLNYLYGKTAQSVSKKQINTAHGKGRMRQRPGVLTCFPISAYCTSVCRAVMGELLNSGNKCYAITTDGFISPVMDINQLKKGVIATATQEVLSSLKDYTGKPYQYIEPSHRADNSLFIKTRGYVLDGTDEDGNRSVKLSRMGIQTKVDIPAEEDIDLQAIEFLKILNAGQFTKRSFPGFSKLKENGKNLLPLKVESNTRISHTFDMKRQPVLPISETTFSYGGVDFTNASFRTVPLETKNDYLLLRKLAERNMDVDGYIRVINRVSQN